MAPYAAATIGNTFGHNGSNPNQAAQLLSHAILGATLAYVNGGNASSGAVAAAGSEAAAIYLTQTLYKDQATDENGVFDPNRLPEKDKEHIRNLTAAIGAVAGGIAGDSSVNAQIAGVVGQNASSNNFLGEKDKQLRDQLRKKIKSGRFTNNEAIDYARLEQKDHVSDELLSKYANNRNALSSADAAILDRLVAEYAQGDPKRIEALLRTFKFTQADFPYAGSEANKNAAGKAWRERASWYEFLLKGRNLSENERTYYTAMRAISANAAHQQWADVSTPALFFATGSVGAAVRTAGLAAGSYNVGQGGRKIAEGEVLSGGLQMLEGAMLAAPGAAGIFKFKTSGGKSVSLPEGYIYDAKTQTISAKTGGTFKLTGQYNDGLPILQRLNPQGVASSNYLVLKDGKQVKVSSPYKSGDTAKISRDTHESAINHTNTYFENLNLKVTTSVTIKSPGAAEKSVLDQVIQGRANSTIPVPDGYIVRDMRTGLPVNSIKLDSNGFAGLEMKTGVNDRSLKRSQEANYRAAIEGKATSTGQKALDARLSEGAAPRQIYIIEPKN